MTRGVQKKEEVDVFRLFARAANFFNQFILRNQRTFDLATIEFPPEEIADISCCDLQRVRHYFQLVTLDAPFMRRELNQRGKIQNEFREYLISKAPDVKGNFTIQFSGPMKDHTYRKLFPTLLQLLHSADHAGRIHIPVNLLQKISYLSFDAGPEITVKIVDAIPINENFFYGITKKIETIGQRHSVVAPEKNQPIELIAYYLNTPPGIFLPERFGTPPLSLTEDWLRMQISQIPWLLRAWMFSCFNEGQILSVVENTHQMNVSPTPTASTLFR